MSHWSPAAVILSLIPAIFIPALLVQFTLGRKGGHHLFKEVPQIRVRELPFDMLQFRLCNQMRGSLATLIGLAVALTLYPAAGMMGQPLNTFVLSDQQLIFIVALGVGLLVILAMALIARHRTD